MSAYRTLAAASTGLFRDRGSKFLAFAYRIDDEQEVAARVAELRSAHYKARHWCYGYRIGRSGDRWRANDDGEPANSAGRPILGQIDSAELTNVLVVVVRYFGGTKLGVSGLTTAYRTAAAEALAAGRVVEAVEERRLRIRTDYAHLSDLMQAAKTEPWRLVRQELSDSVEVVLAAPADQFETAHRRLWLVLAKAYPGEEQLDRSPTGYDLSLI